MHRTVRSLPGINKGDRADLAPSPRMAVLTTAHCYGRDSLAEQQSAPDLLILASGEDHHRVSKVGSPYFSHGVFQDLISQFIAMYPVAARVILLVHS